MKPTTTNIPLSEVVVNNKIALVEHHPNIKFTETKFTEGHNICLADHVSIPGTVWSGSVLSIDRHDRYRFHFLVKWRDGGWGEVPKVFNEKHIIGRVGDVWSLSFKEIT